MNPRELARADQLCAALREAERPVNVFELYRLSGTPGDWSIRETFLLLDQLRLENRLELEREPCCIVHALWALPADV